MSKAGVVLLTLAVLSTGTGTLEAQRRRQQSIENVEQFNVPYDGTFIFLRLRYTPLQSYGRRGFEQFWDHDYPRAEQHLSTMLEELTLIEPNRGSTILAADDPELFKFPLAYISEPGHWSLTDEEAENLRNYVLKGGFLIFDDFSGGDWFNFEQKITQVLPEAVVVEMDASHQIFHSFYDIDRIDTFVHPYYGLQSVFYGVFEDNDPSKRLLAIVNYNNDIGESWEWSDSGWIPIDITNDAYQLGINYIVYSMAH